MKQINLGGIQLPIESATKSFAFLGKRGSGKTYNAAVLAEEFIRLGIPIIVIDPIDVWWGLKVAADGKGKGLDVIVFGIEHADIPLDEKMGREIVEAVLDNKASIVISTFGMPKAAQRRLVTELSEELLRRNNSPRHVFIEEAHEFAPQRVMGDMGKVFNAVSNLVVMGRNRGIGVTLINQRAATINKDVLTQIDTMIALRNVAPQDRKALREWVEHYAVQDKFDQFMDSLPSLKTGDAWIWSPEFLDVFQKVRIRKRTTFHPDREKIGESFVMPDMGKLDVSGFVERFKDKIAKRKDEQKSDRETIADLKREVKELQRQIASNQKPVAAPDIEAIKQAAINNCMNELSSAFIKNMETQRDNIKNSREAILRAFDGFEKNIEIANESIRDAILKTGKMRPLGVNKTHEERIFAMARQSGKDTLVRANLNKIIKEIISTDVKLTGGTFRMLEVLVSRYPIKLTRAQLGTLAHLVHTGGTFSNYLSVLRQNQFIVEDGRTIQASELGLAYFGNDLPEPMTTEEVIRQWQSNLKGGARRMFDILLDIYPQTLSRKELAEQANLEASAGTFSNYLSILRTNCLIVESNGEISLSPELYL